jgi:hypothetical protein
MYMRKLLISSLVASVTFTLSSGEASAQQAPNAAINMRVAGIGVTAAGAIYAIPESGTLKLTDGSTPPSCNGGLIIVSQNPAGTAYSDVIKDRMLATLTSAQLSGRTVQMYVTRNASNQCFMESIIVLNQ